MLFVMSTISRNRKAPAYTTLFRPNPILNRLGKDLVHAETDTATYRGIAVKTTFFLIMTMVGIIAQLLVKAALANEPVWQTFKIYEKWTVSLSMKETLIFGGVMILGLVSQLVGIFARKTIPVTGSLYSASQGYVISFLVFKVLVGYEYLGLEALLLTVAVVAGMSWLYSSGKVRVNKKFHTVLLTLLIGSVGVGVLSFLASLIPAARPYVQAMAGNPVFAVAMDVLGLVIAALFLISDFSVIDECVKSGSPREYEWGAAFGLVFTVIWIYLKILDLIMRFAGKDKD